MGRLIIGSNWMTDRDVNFDLTNSRVLIFESPDCGQTKSQPPPVNASSLPKRALRMMYKTMRPRLQDENASTNVGWSWLVLLVIVLIIALLVSVVTICVSKAHESDQQKSDEPPAIEE